MQRKSVAILGVGLIGGSIGLALRRRNLAPRIVGIGRDRRRLEAALRHGAVTDIATLDGDLAAGLDDVGIVVVCTPVGLIPDHVRRVAEAAAPATLITDGGSTKRTIVETLDGPLPHDCRFVGSHPMAGSEKTGVENAVADLFEGRVTIVTPTGHTAEADVARLSAFWEAIGSKVIRMTPSEHDRAVALASHLPHALAVALAAGLPDGLRQVAGSGFRDTSRVAAGDPEMWCQIFLDNRESVLQAIETFREHLNTLAAAIGREAGGELKALLTLAKKNRDALGS